MSRTQHRTPARPTRPAPNGAEPLQPRWALRIALFSALAVVCVAVGVGYVLHANERTADEERNAKKVSVAGPASLGVYEREPHIVFRSTALGDTYGKVALVPRGNVGAPRAVSDLSCERVDIAADRGVCLEADRGVVTTYHGVIFDRHFETLNEFDLAGAPSRVRVSPDGHWAGITVFVTGHSYADLNFSTRTNILDLRTGEMLPDLEQFTVRKDGVAVDSIDRNYWGVTFKPSDGKPGSDGFYATLQTGGHIYLIEGDVSSRTAKVVGDDVECPSLSPDGTKIAFKVRNSGGSVAAVSWHLAVLDLATGRRQNLAERRSVDDQVSWLGNDTVVYGLPRTSTGSAETNLWSIPADGSGKPAPWIIRAWSPSIVS